ncbi:MAG: hypothetical protein ACI9UA_005729, partial [Pseudoalteromonas tetraodonis]
STPVGNRSGIGAAAATIGTHVTSIAAAAAISWGIIFKGGNRGLATAA